MNCGAAADRLTRRFDPQSIESKPHVQYTHTHTLAEFQPRTTHLLSNALLIVRCLGCCIAFTLRTAEGIITIPNLTSELRSEYNWRLSHKSLHWNCPKHSTKRSEAAQLFQNRWSTLQSASTFTPLSPKGVRRCHSWIFLEMLDAKSCIFVHHESLNALQLWKICNFNTIGQI